MAATRPSVRVASSGPVRRRRERVRLAGWGRSHVGSGGGWLLVESRATKLPRQLTLGGSGRFMGGVDYSAAWGGRSSCSTGSVLRAYTSTPTWGRLYRGISRVGSRSGTWAGLPRATALPQYGTRQLMPGGGGADGAVP